MDLPEGVTGVGIDAVEVERLRRLLEHLPRAYERLYSEQERTYVERYSDPYPRYAARFAAKEAVSKAFGTGIGAALGWQDIEVCRRDSGEPYVVLHDKGQTLLASRGARVVHLSLSHTEKHAVAVAILESA